MPIPKMLKVAPVYRSPEGCLYVKVSQADALDNPDCIRGDYEQGKRGTGQTGIVRGWFQPLNQPKPTEPAK